MLSSKFLKFWFPVIGYSGIIFYVSSLTDLQIPVAGANVDKVLHIIEFMPLGYLFARALKGEGRFRLVYTLIWGTVFCLFYGLSDELHQLFVLGRSGSFLDAAADTLGGYWGSWIFCWRVKKKEVVKA